jgi:predicted RNA-binding protein YlqC (UPF0109 family)
MSDLKSLVEFLSKTLVDHPDDVSIKEIPRENAIFFELKVNKADLGQVIGKQGKTARAIRTILNFASTKKKKRALLEITE